MKLNGPCEVNMTNRREVVGFFTLTWIAKDKLMTHFMQTIAAKNCVRSESETPCEALKSISFTSA